MKYTFGYSYSSLPTQQIEVEEVSDFSLVMYDSFGGEYWVNVSTELGDTKLIFYGPLLPDIADITLNKFKLEYEKFPYQESKITKKVDSYIVKNNIDHIEEVMKEEFLERLKEVMENGFRFSR